MFTKWSQLLWGLLAVTLAVSAENIANPAQLITLNCKNLPLSVVLPLIAEFNDYNIVMSDAVTGLISIRLTNIPWDQALDAILEAKGLAKRQTGKIIYIDKAKTLMEQENKKLKDHWITAELRPLQSALLPLHYAKASDIAGMLKDKTNSLLSKRGAISVDNRTNSLWLRDTQEQILEIKKWVKQLDVPVKQVLIEARIVNIARECVKDLGIRWSFTKGGGLSGTSAGSNQGAHNTALANVPLEHRLNVDLAAVPVEGIIPPSLGLALAKLGGDFLLDLELSALESAGKAEIVASPRLLTTNQQAAVIESGEDIPYQQSTPMGATSVAFKKAVLSLKVTPQIISNKKLLIELQVTQDADSGQRVQGVPIVTTKAIQTNVLADNGQTIVLGGIYMQNKNKAQSGVPILSDLPIFGYFFRKTAATNKNEELLIFITPRIMSAVVGSEIKKE